MLPPVIAGVDGSPESLAAAEWAAREAVRRGRPLRLLHAWNRPSHRGGTPADPALRHLARRALRQAEDRIRRTCPGVVALQDRQVEGPPTAALLTAAQGADLLVLGSRGLSGFTGFLVGSVALGVVARAELPVVLVRAGEEAADEHLPAADGSASTRTPYRDVVMGLDLDDPCDEVIEYGFEAARTRGARLRVVHACRPPAAFGGLGPATLGTTMIGPATLGPTALGPGELGLLDGPERLEEWHGFLTAVLQPWRDKYPGVEVTETVTEGRAPSPLIRAASSAGLLVVGRRVTDRPARPRTGPVTHAVIHHAGCPVAVVPHT
ncbi:universal stress protein [Streptomyces sp. NPDC018693]|uniref:universal stress protein n=1 Tax=unclassified Streptomyces TaxID=2593676 RepID=UPI0037A73CAC